MVFSSLFQPTRCRLFRSICDLQGRWNLKGLSKILSPSVGRSIVWCLTLKRKILHTQFISNSWNHNDDNELPEKKQTSCRICENILKASFFEMSPRNWLKTTLFDFCKKGADTLCSYHVDHTNNKMNVKTLFTNHFKSCFFQTKACLAWKLLDFLPWSAEHYGTSNCTKDLFNCVCNTPNFVFQLL